MLDPTRCAWTNETAFNCALMLLGTVAEAGAAPSSGIVRANAATRTAAETRARRLEALPILNAPYPLLLSGGVR